MPSAPGPCPLFVTLVHGQNVFSSTALNSDSMPLFAQEPGGEGFPAWTCNYGVMFGAGISVQCPANNPANQPGCPVVATLNSKGVVVPGDTTGNYNLGTLLSLSQQEGELGNCQCTYVNNAGTSFGPVSQ